MATKKNKWIHSEQIRTCLCPKSIRFAEGALFYDLSLILFCIQSWRAGWPVMPFSSGHSKLKYIDHELFLWVPRLRLLGKHKLWDISAAPLHRCVPTQRGCRREARADGLRAEAPAAAGSWGTQLLGSIHMKRLLFILCIMLTALSCFGACCIVTYLQQGCSILNGSVLQTQASSSQLFRLARSESI